MLESNHRYLNLVSNWFFCLPKDTNPYYHIPCHILIWSLFWDSHKIRIFCYYWYILKECIQKTTRKPDGTRTPAAANEPQPPSNELEPSPSIKQGESANEQTASTSNDSGTLPLDLSVQVEPCNTRRYGQSHQPNGRGTVFDNYAFVLCVRDQLG